MKAWNWALAAQVAVFLAAGAHARSAHAGLLVEPALAAGCDWSLAYDPEVTDYGNTAFPTTHARYWIAVVSDTVPAGSVLRIEGHYPHARYAAVHVYDGIVFFHDALADFEIAPEAGSSLPFVDQTRRDATVAAGGAYTMQVRIFTAQPQQREPNTAYRLPPGLLDGRTRRRTLISYRTYLPEGDSAGGVELPKLTVVTPDGIETPLPNPQDADACAVLTDRLQHSNGSAVPVSLAPPLVPALNPTFYKYDHILLKTLGLGVGYNPHNGFMYAKGDWSYGDFLLVRGKLPAFTDQADVDVPQVRHWSLCEYGAGSSKVYGCLADADMKLDADGYYTAAISVDAAQPAFLADASGYNWLNWGKEMISAVLIRELLARDDFAESVRNAPVITPANTRGDYMPLASYCSRSTLQSGVASGATPAQVFSACQAEGLHFSN